jgi:hypothetical protein
MVYLLTAIGLTPGGSSTVYFYTQTIHKTTQLKIEQHNNRTTQLTIEQKLTIEQHNIRTTQLTIEQHN